MTMFFWLGMFVYLYYLNNYYILWEYIEVMKCNFNKKLTESFYYYAHAHAYTPQNKDKNIYIYI